MDREVLRRLEKLNQLALTEEEKAAALAWLGAVGFTNYAQNGKAGVVDTRAAFGVNCDQWGRLQIVKAENADIDAKTHEYKPIVPKTLDYAVKKALTDCKIEWTEEEKTAARKLLGIE